MSSGYNPPPYNPPDNGMQQMLQLMNLRAQQDQTTAQQEALRQKREEDATQRYLDSVAAGMDPEVAAQNVPGLSVAGYNLGLETAKALKKQQREALALSPQGQSAFQTATSPSVGPGGAVQPPDAGAREAAGAVYQGLPPEYQPYFNLLAGSGAAEAGAKAAQLEYERREYNRKVGVETAAQASRAATSASIAETARLKSQRRDVLTNSLHSGIIALNRGEITPQELTSIVENARANGASAAEINSAYHTAAMGAVTGAVELRRQEQSIDKGKQSVVSGAEDFRSSLDAQGYDTSEVTDAQLRLMYQGKAFLEPISLRQGRAVVELAPGGEGEIKARTEGRIAIQTVMDQFPIVRESFDTLSEAVKSGRVTVVGPGVPDIVSGFAEFLGSASPEAETYRTAQFLTIANLVKMKSGAQANQFELQRYLAVMPSFQEAGRPSGKAKLDVFEKMISIDAANIGRIRNAPRVAATPEDEAIAQKLQSVQNDPKKLAKFLADDLPKWQQRRGSAWQVPGLDVDAPTPKSQRSVDKVWGPGAD